MGLKGGCSLPFTPTHIKVGAIGGVLLSMSRSHVGSSIQPKHNSRPTLGLETVFERKFRFGAKIWQRSS